VLFPQRVDRLGVFLSGEFGEVDEVVSLVRKRLDAKFSEAKYSSRISSGIALGPTARSTSTAALSSTSTPAPSSAFKAAA
jgi:hypothetical protein